MLRAGSDTGVGEPSVGQRTVSDRTAQSFAYEWARFGELRGEWQKNFLDYMQPHPAGFFEGLTVLDVGTGSGRHSHQTDLCGAQVVAVDLGDSIDVARRNLPDRVLTVQAAAEALPFDEGSFDFVMSIGVLHHLADPAGTLRSIARYARPGGRVRVYLYWEPPRRWHRRLLGIVTATRRFTTRMPHRLLHALCYPIAAVVYCVFVLPYGFMRGIPKLHRIADAFPLKTYADYPFGVCVNDQFDRFSAPIETRYTRAEVEAMMAGAGLEEIEVRPHHGWIAEGTRPAAVA
jgi:ubiquinone/menaquinone biosynthesis C-methylase UbiE